MPDGMPISDPYQIIIEGIWGHGRVGYVAFDDISFFDGDCTSEPLLLLLLRLLWQLDLVPQAEHRHFEPSRCCDESRHK